MSKVATIKTKPTEAGIEAFLASITDDQKRQDSQTLLQLMEKASGQTPKMWGSSIIGFGDKRYKSPTSDREVDWFIIGFSPRKANLVLYLVADVQQHSTALENLGKHKLGAGCLYINKLADVDKNVLETIIKSSIK
jgi:hypothetical protein